MSTVREILRAKGSHVETVPAQMSLLEAVKVMNLHRIGCVVVTDAEQHVCGLLSERDVMILAAEDPTSLAQLSVGEAMTTEVLVCHQEDPIDSVRATMRSKWIRQMPVLTAEGELAGIVSLGDANAFRIDEEDFEIKYLHDYIEGRVW